MNVIILAGGMGKRLRSVVSDVPKPMAPIAGKPFLELILSTLASAHVDNIILSVGYLAHIIKDYFGDHFGNIPLVYAEETTPLGTGGAIVNALQFHSEEPVLILNGDTLLELNYDLLFEWYYTETPDIAMVLTQVDDITRYGSVVINSDNKVEGFIEKGASGPGLINCGSYIIKPSILNGMIPLSPFSFESDFLQKNINQFLPSAYITSSFFIDIGLPETYLQLNLDKIQESDANIKSL